MPVAVAMAVDAKRVQTLRQATRLLENKAILVRRAY
jgi:hypothetical protein